MRTMLAATCRIRAMGIKGITPVFGLINGQDMSGSVGLPYGWAPGAVSRGKAT